MNQRIKDLKENIQNLNDAGIRKTYLYQYVAESLKQTEGEPTQIRRAKGFAYVLENVEQQVLPYEKLAGTMLGMCPLYDNVMSKEQQQDCATKVIEEYLEGPEVSVLAFTDGKVVKPMVSSMDHKRSGDNDTGLNTGGMGTIAPNPYYTDEVAKICMDTIFVPTINAMNKERRTFKGCLYFGLMLTKDGPKVIEYNCRFGDPETQVVLPLLESDLLTVMKATTDGTLSETEVKFKDGNACCVIMASDGYPVSYKKGYEITIPEDISDSVYIAGAAKKDGKLYTSGGRVLGVTSVAPTLKEAIDSSYKKVKTISFENAYYRLDIGQRALKATEE